MRTDRSALLTGAIGGALAATAVVIFFFVEDLIQGRLMETPRFLSQVVFGEAEAGVGILALYTVMHYALMMAVGAGVGWLLDRARVPATLLLGLVVGFLLFDLVFYASIWMTGIDVVAELGWPSFLAGNLVAGLTIMGYLRWAGAPSPRSWREALRAHRALREGLVAGLVGAAAVAAWFLVVDLSMGRLFFTPAALGSALFAGVTDASAVQVTATTVLGYSLIHLVAFTLTGLVFAVLVGQSERYPPLLLALALLFVTFETLVIGMLAIVAAWLLDVIPAWSIAAANLIAAVAMGYYLWRKHPTLSAKLRQAEQRDLGPREAPGVPKGPGSPGGAPPLQGAGPRVPQG